MENTNQSHVPRLLLDVVIKQRNTASNIAAEFEASYITVANELDALKKKLKEEKELNKIQKEKGDKK